MRTAKSITLPALLSALAILLGYVEHLIPVVPPIACIKLGLGNIAVLLCLYGLDATRTAWGVSLTKIIVCAALFGGMGSLPYSLAGGVTSLCVMCLLRRENGSLSAAGISAAGGAFHMAAQVIVAAMLTATPEVLTLLPLLMAVGTVTGLGNGALVNILCPRLRCWLHNQAPLSSE